MLNTILIFLVFVAIGYGIKLLYLKLSRRSLPKIPLEKKSINEEEFKESFPYEVISVHGKDALDILHDMIKDNKNEFRPILISNPKFVLDNLEIDSFSVEETLKKAKEINVTEWFEERIEQDKEYYDDVEIGTWPNDEVQHHQITANIDILSREPLEIVYIAKIPTLLSYEIPAYLNIGGWNECPFPAEHVAIQKHWYEKYHAEMITYTGDVIEFKVTNPPIDKDEADALAHEQFIYCSDIVYQGVETLKRLAATVYKDKYWYFWWD